MLRMWKSPAIMFLVPILSWILIWLIGKTVRLNVIGEAKVETLRGKGRNFLYAFWHNRLLLITYCLRNRGIQVMVSSSRDGEYISRTVRRFGATPIRGSTTSGGAKGLLQMARRLRAGCDGAITPDGPQGPRYIVQPGIVNLAGKISFPILPLTYNARRKIVLHSWDAFIIPCPFTRAVLIYGDPVEVPVEANAQVLEVKRQELEEVLKDITRRADRYFNNVLPYGKEDSAPVVGRNG